MAKFIFDNLDKQQQLPPLLWWFGWVTKSIMRDRIRELGGEAVKTFSLGDIVALALHDRENEVGLAVVSAVNQDGHVVPGGHAWTAYGDGHMSTTPLGADTKTMATAAVIASLRDLERVRGVGVKLGGASITPAQKAAEIRGALGADGFAARAYVPRESKVAGANLPYALSNGKRAPLEWRWGQLGDEAAKAVDKTVRQTIPSELKAMADKVKEPLNAPMGIKVYGVRRALRAFARHLNTDGIAVLEKAVGRPAR
jgi:hypothetical protein